MMYYKTEIKVLKRDIKRKFGSISRFAKLSNLNEYEFRKLLQRIENNRKKYAINFDPDQELERIKRTVYIDDQTKTIS